MGLGQTLDPSNISPVKYYIHKKSNDLKDILSAWPVQSSLSYDTDLLLSTPHPL